MDVPDRTESFHLKRKKRQYLHLLCEGQYSNRLQPGIRSRRKAEVNSWQLVKREGITDLTVLNVDLLESPSPVPIHKNGSLSICDGYVGDGELLIPDPHAVFTLRIFEIGRPFRAKEPN